MSPRGSNIVTIERKHDPEYGDVFIISDEDSEFARATTITATLRYASDLLYGPGTGLRGTVWNMMELMEEDRKT